MSESIFFVSDVPSEISAFYTTTRNGSLLESDERLVCTDVICEGPIEGLVNKDGELLKYVSDSNDSNIENLILGKGVYYNDVPLIDSKLDKLNFVTLGFNIAYGEEFNLYKNQYASTIHRYNQKLYLNEINRFETQFPSLEGVFCFAKQNNFYFELNNNINDKNGFASTLKTNFKLSEQNGYPNLIKELDEAKNYCQEFNHKIKNKYADQISVQIRADQLFATTNGSTTLSDLLFIVEISEENSADRFFAICRVFGISKSGYVIDLPINLSLNSVTFNNYFVKIYCLSTKILPTNGTVFKEVSIAGVVERIKNKIFSYPFSAIVKSGVSSRHFNKDPDRTFDLKLLKIRVPQNYDPECREYSGNWNGAFSSFLRWTDNPAWIFFDLCTNSRYGIGNGKIFEKDLNKWELYKISKYCDELVKVATPNKFYEDQFTININYPNSLIVSVEGKNGSARTLEEIKAQYPPVYDNNASFATQNGGFQNSIIYLFDIKYGETKIETVYKKIIWSVEAILLDSNGDETVVGTDVVPSYYKINLINDFGPRKFFETDTNGIFKSFCESEVIQVDTDISLTERIQNSKRNTEGNAKSFILQKIAQKYRAKSSTYNNLISENIFPQSLLDQIEESGSSLFKGLCLPRSLNYRDPFEQRFSCNLYIDNETESLKLLNDMVSVFRGLVYYKNNYITSTIDVDKPISYIFNNSNVKNGLFSYSSASLDGNYTVAKVMFKDKYENFTEQVEIVEDSQLIKDYGIVVKEILGFGITSRDQARRIGQWLLLTNRLENQSITFSTDLQGLLLKPSDIIQIQDEFKNNLTIQGRVADVNYDDKYIVVDRQLNLSLTNKVIKFLFNNAPKTVADLDALDSVSDSDLDTLQSSQVVELKIDRIENNTCRVYFKEDYNFNLFNRVIASTPFIIIDTNENNSVNLYKIVSISELENNEYSIFCIKHNPAKYEALTSNKFEISDNFEKNTIAFSNSDVVTNIDVDNINFYSINGYYLTSVSEIDIDYSFSELRSSLVMNLSDSKDYYVLFLNMVILFNQIHNFSNDSGNAKQSYYTKIQNVLNDSGGLLCKIICGNQSIVFSMKNDNIINKSVFLGKFGVSGISLAGSVYVKFYLYDKENKIISV